MDSTIAQLKAKVDAGKATAETKKQLGDAYAADKRTYGDALTWYSASAEEGSAEGAA